MPQMVRHTIFRQHVPPLSSYVAHLGFFLWSCPNQPDWFIHMTASFVIGIIQEQKERDALFSMREIVPAVIGQQDPMQFFHDLVLREGIDMLEPSRLYHNLLVAVYLLRGCGPSVVVSEEGRKKALYALARVFQRYRCCGERLDEAYPSQMLCEVILKCIQ